MIRMTRLLLALFVLLPAFSQDRNVDCKCRQVLNDEYTCKCIVVSGTTPALFDFLTVVNGKTLTGEGAVPSIRTTVTPKTVVAPQKAAIAPTISTTAAADAAHADVAATSATADAPATTESSTAASTTTGKTVHTGPRGGQYHYSASGKKVYERKKK